MSEDELEECIPSSAVECSGCHDDRVCCKNCILCMIEEDELGEI